jgi:hypothetical protein
MPIVQIKTLSRLHRVARMTVAGMRDERIADAVGLTYAGLAQLKQRPEFKELVQEVLQGTITKYDEQLAGDIAALRSEFAVGVPVAMRTLLEAVQQKKDLKASIEAAKEILDRDPNATFSKSSRQTTDHPQTPTLSDAQIASLGIESDKIAKESYTPKEQVN